MARGSRDFVIQRRRVDYAMKQVPVLIIGAGPVGLALAADLGWRGIKCLIVDQDPPNERTRFARHMWTSVRTMEFCRRLGIAERIANWGFPLDYPLDNVFVAGNLVGPELARAPMPSLGALPTPPQSPTHQTQCPQLVFDPILLDLACSFETVEMRRGWKLESLRQDAGAVTANLTCGQEEERIVCSFLVACDGATSTVRSELGISMTGRGLLDRSMSIEFSTASLEALHDKGPAGRYICIGTQGTWCTCMPVDGRGRWRILLYNSGEDVSSLNVEDVVNRLIGRPFDYRIKSVKPWARRALVASRYGEGRVFLAGDAAHVHPPNGGFGMNTGFADAIDLGWKLDLVVRGIAPERLLESYEVERRPIAIRAVNEAVRELERLASTKTDYSSIETPGPEGEALRRLIGERMHSEYEGDKGWDRLGIHLGYVYSPSPIVIEDGTPVPFDDTNGYIQTGRPGARAPHVWLPDGRSTLDLFGRHFVLLNFHDTDAHLGPMCEAARRRGLPLETHSITDQDTASLYGASLVLVRPDGHVAWRGDECPKDPDQIFDHVLGGVAEERLETREADHATVHH